MIHIHAEVTIARPLPEVFAYTTEAANNPRWQVGIKKTYRTPNSRPIQVGDTITEVRSLLGRQATFKATVTEFVPNERAALQSHEGRLSYASLLRFVEVHGGTRVILDVDFDLKAFAWAEKVAEGMLQQITEQGFVSLKRILERDDS